MQDFSRRALIAAGATALLSARQRALGQNRAYLSSEMLHWMAELEFPGGKPVNTLCVFDIAKGKYLGTYQAPSGKFIQHCIRVRHPSLPHFFVDFRPDEKTDRMEVVFWNGECMGDVPDGHTSDLPSYRVVLKNNGNIVHAESVRQHVWGCRWRYQSAARPEIRTTEQLFSDGFLPHMSKKAARIEGYSGVIVPKSPTPVANYTTFMAPDDPAANSKLGLTCDIDRGGERPEIGLVTEWQADYLLNRTAASKHAMYQQAEMCGSDWHWYIPDQITGALVNYKQDPSHYKAYTYYQHYGSPGQYYQIGNSPAWNGWNAHEAESHIPSVFYVPYALTEDPYYVEGQQAIVQWGTGWDIYGRENSYGFGKIGGPRTCCSYGGEIRTLGWGIRNLAMAYKMSPENAPDWLLSKRYYAALSQDYAIVIDALWTRNTAHLHSIFRQLSNDNYFQTFEQAYAIMGMALADLVGMPANPSWHSALDFYFGMLDGTLSGKTGWDHQVPCPHDILSKDFEPFTTWKQAYEHFKPVFTATASFPNAPSPGNRQGGSMGNTSQAYAACACANSRGIRSAKVCMDWLNIFIDYNYPNNADRSGGIAFYMKCGFDGT